MRNSPRSTPSAKPASDPIDALLAPVKDNLVRDWLMEILRFGEPASSNDVSAETKTTIKKEKTK